MRITICDKCGNEITEDVEIVLGHELCPKCVNAVDTFITRSMRPATMDEVRDFCNNFYGSCKECPFGDDKDGVCGGSCSLKLLPCNWSSEDEIFSKLLDYKINHPDWRKKE